MSPERLRRVCLQHPGAEETFPFSEGVSVFKVAGKIFALSGLRSTPLTVSVKCDPDLAVQLRDTYPEIRPGYHLNKHHWNTVTVDGELPDGMVHDMIEDSYDLVAPRRAAPSKRKGR